MQDQRSRICDIQYSRILDVLANPQSPEDILQTCRSLAKRRQLWARSGRESFDFIQRLSHWISISGSSVLVVQTAVRAEPRAKDLTVEVINLLQATSYQVIYSLSQPYAVDRAYSVIDVFKTLVYQALRHNPDIVLKDPGLVNIARFQADHTEAEWLALTRLVFSKIARCFVILEVEQLYRASGRETDCIRRLLQTFQDIVDSVTSSGNVLKLLFVSYETDRAKSVMSPRHASCIVASVERAPPAIRRRKQPFNSGPRTFLRRSGIKPTLIRAERTNVSRRQHTVAE
jgi:hypothetical protein